jgi:carbonic anhydrase
MPGYDDLLAANERYAADFRLQGITAPAAKGLAVVLCMDSRIEPLAMLGLVPGDAKILRNAGARISDDALRSLVLAVNFLDVERVAIVAHTDCAMTHNTDQGINDTLAERYPDAPLDIPWLTVEDQAATIAADIERVRACPLLPPDLEVAGFIYDVSDGRLRRV